MLFEPLAETMKPFRTETLRNYVIVITFISLIIGFFILIHKTGGGLYYQMQEYERKIVGIKKDMGEIKEGLIHTYRQTQPHKENKKWCDKPGSVWRVRCDE